MINFFGANVQFSPLQFAFWISPSEQKGNRIFIFLYHQVDNIFWQWISCAKFKRENIGRNVFDPHLSRQRERKRITKRRLFWSKNLCKSLSWASTGSTAINILHWIKTRRTTTSFIKLSGKLNKTMRNKINTNIKWREIWINFLCAS